MLFRSLALSGAKHHGIDFLDQAIANGAVAVITDQKGSNQKLPTLVVDNPRRFAGDIASGAAVAVMYDGTNFQLLTESGGQSETVSNLIATGGLYAKGNFGGTYTDGIVVDYTSTLGRISTGTSDGLAFYNGGVATTELMRLDSSGNLGLGEIGRAHV